ncbi:MAG: Uma2 family endonuclease [Dactylosporangium sp.]|nr:Uma2 family endonuclease [Dactylosporangium sp.]
MGRPEAAFERLASSGGDVRFELVNGRLEVRGEMPRRWHQHVLKLLIRYFDQLGFYALSELGAKVAEGTIRIADIAVLPSADVLAWDQTILPANQYHTLVEIISPDSEERDKITTLAEYAMAGVPNYWIVSEDPFRPEDGIVARYVNEGGTFRLVDTVSLSSLLG